MASRPIEILRILVLAGACAAGVPALAASHTAAVVVSAMVETRCAAVPGVPPQTAPPGPEAAAASVAVDCGRSQPVAVSVGAAALDHLGALAPAASDWKVGAGLALAGSTEATIILATVAF